MFLINTSTGALRCCRRIVGLKDEFYNRYIVKGKLFDAIVESFKCNENRYNLLNSATVELFEFIRQVSLASGPCLSKSHLYLKFVINDEYFCRRRTSRHFVRTYAKNTAPPSQISNM